MVLDAAGVLVVVLAFSLAGLVLLRRWLPPGKALGFVVATTLVKCLVVAFRYYVAIGGSENEQLTSDTYRYLSYGETVGSSGESLGALFFHGDETTRVVVFSGVVFKLFGNSWVSVYWAGAFLGLFAMWVFWGALLKVFGTTPMWYGFALCVFPSSLYWSSSLGKESLTLMGLSLGVYGAVSFWAGPGSRGRAFGLASSTAGVALLSAVRFEIAFLFVVALIGAVVAVRPALKDVGQARLRRGGLMGIIVALPVLVFVVPQVLGWGGLGLAENLFGRYENTSIGSSQLGGDRPPGLWGLIVGLPVAIFRPFPWEAGVTGLASSLDTLLLVALAVCTLRLYRLLTAGRMSMPAARILIVAVVVIVGMFAALAGYGNLGLLVRMRSMIVPLSMAVVFLYLLSKNLHREIVDAQDERPLGVYGSDLRFVRRGGLLPRETGAR